MIKSIDHARRVCARRQSTGKRGLPRAVTRFMSRDRNNYRVWEPSRAIRANVLNLSYNSPL